METPDKSTSYRGKNPSATKSKPKRCRTPQAEVMKRYRAHKKAGTILMKWWVDLDLLAEILTRCGIAVPAPDPETGDHDPEALASCLDELLKQHVKGLIEIRRV
jgi:hypothetical protein